MALVRAKDTGPELRVRRMTHALGYRYRLHGRGLPGRPDLVFPGRRKVILVHGCFWHRHPGCPRARFPKSPERAAFWREKLMGNARRDRRNERALREAGWKILVIWECQTEKTDALQAILRGFLSESGPSRRP